MTPQVINAPWTIKGEMEKHVRCAFYGSLRRPMYNYKRLVNRFGSDSMKHICVERIKGWEMYDLGACPGIVNASADSEIYVELFEVSMDAYDFIHGMETSAEFYEDDVIIGGKSYKIFPYAGNVYDASVVAIGDWLRYEYMNNKITKDEICNY